MRGFSLKRFLSLGLCCLIFILPSVSFGKETSRGFEAERARILSFIIRQHLSQHHFSQKSFDDNFSAAAFKLYLEQIDYQKRFLTKDSVAEIVAFRKLIDDEMILGQVDLPEITYLLMQQRIAEVRKVVDALLEYPFDFSREEAFETDPKKRTFCKNNQELQDRWRKILKYQMSLNYLNSINKENEDRKKPLSSEEKKHYWEEAREKALKNYRNLLFRLSNQDLRTFYSLYFNAVARAFDPHTNYLDPTMEEDFDISMKGSLEGIGASLREEDGYIKVVEIIPGSAAARQGKLAKEDTILKVGQGNEEPVDISQMRLRDAVKLIRGKKGTEVRLTTRKPNGNIVVIPIVRDVVKIEDTFVKSACLKVKDSDARVGYIFIPAFYRDLNISALGKTGRNSTDDFKEALNDLKKQDIQGLIIDLRNDGGGALQDAVNIAGMFIEKGPVVQVKNSQGKVKVLDDVAGSIEFTKPVVVLVNKFSASASEILAGALQDYRRAVIVGGEHTHGKGTVQALIDLDQGYFSKKMDKYQPFGALKITIQKFYRINGGSTQYRGVVPDIVLPDRLKPLQSGEKYLDYSLPWDKVEAADYQSWPFLKSSVLPSIYQKSERRTKDNPAFSKILQEIALEEKRMVNTRQSLNFNEFRKEREELRELQNREKVNFEDFVVLGKGKNGVLEGLPQDPYVREAFFILKDLLGVP